MFCPECGREVADDAKFCPHCGHSLDVAVEGEGQDVPTEDRGPQPATPEPTSPASPSAPEPAAPTEGTPPPATAETARQGAAEEMAEEPQPTPGPPQPTQQEPPQPRASTSYTGPPPSGGEQPTGQPAAGQQQAPPPEGGAPAGAPAEEKSGPNWGAICLIGCGVLLLLGIGAGALFYFVGKTAINQVDQMDVPQTIQNKIEERGGDAGAADETTGEEPGDGAADGEDGFGDVLGQIGEAVEGAGRAISASSIKGFDPARVDPQMLPAFYGSLIGIANSDRQAVMKWMSPGLKEDLSDEQLSFISGIEHRGYELARKTVQDDGSVVFEIDQLTYDPQLDEEVTVTWDLTFEQTNGEWRLTDISHSNG